MSRRDFLKNLRDIKYPPKTPVFKGEEVRCESTDLYKRAIIDVTHELERQRKISAPIKIPSFFDRLSREERQLTRDKKNALKKAVKHAELYNSLVLPRSS